MDMDATTRSSARTHTQVAGLQSIDLVPKQPGFVSTPSVLTQPPTADFTSLSQNDKTARCLFVSNSFIVTIPRFFDEAECAAMIAVMLSGGLTPASGINPCQPLPPFLPFSSGLLNLRKWTGKDKNPRRGEAYLDRDNATFSHEVTGINYKSHEGQESRRRRRRQEGRKGIRAHTYRQQTQHAYFRDWQTLCGSGCCPVCQHCQVAGRLARRRSSGPVVFRVGHTALLCLACQCVAWRACVAPVSACWGARG
jgi:hypothetical protein